MTSSLPLSRTELLLVLSATLLGLGLRVWHLDRLAVEHFDEGVYASNLYFSEDENYRYPDQHLYAPPLVPSLIEWSMTFFGDAPWVPMLPGIVFGTATVPLLWWMLRGLAGPSAGMLAGWLLATNEYHIFYSRTALTEPVLGFFWVLALGLGARALLVPIEAPAKRAYLLAVLAGVACGLAWWTKYNGWLTSFLIVATAGTHWLGIDRSWAGLRRQATVCLIIVSSMVIVYAPFLWTLQKYGGYAAVSAHHQQYLVGLNQYASTYWTQALNFSFMTTNWTLLGLLAALAVSLYFCWHTWRQRVEHFPDGQRNLANLIWIVARCLLFIAVFTTATGLVSFPIFVVAALGWILARAMIQSSLNASEPYTRALSVRDESLASDGQSVGVWLIWIWVPVMLLLTPLYYPYPRLLLPLVLGLICGMSTVFGFAAAQFRFPTRSDVAGSFPGGKTFGASMRRAAAVALAAVISLAFNFSQTIPGFPKLAPDRTRLMQATSDIADRVREEASPSQTPPSIIYVMGEPAVYWHLSQQRLLAGPVSTLEFAQPEFRPEGVDLYLVTGPHANSDPKFQSELESTGGFTQLGEFTYGPSLLIRQDRGLLLKDVVDRLTLWKLK